MDTKLKGDIAEQAATLQALNRVMLRSNYRSSDFDFALLYIDQLSLFYVMPVDVFNAYGSEIHLVEEQKRQRKPASAAFRDAWSLLDEAR